MALGRRARAAAPDGLSAPGARNRPVEVRLARHGYTGKLRDEEGRAPWGENLDGGTIDISRPPHNRTGTMTPTTPTTRELAHRRNDGLDIQLLWDPATDRVAVALHDSKTGEGFEVEVGPGERALDVFHHPFAYAAFREAARKRRLPQLAEAA